jgi:hypothetical protein
MLFFRTQRQLLANHVVIVMLVVSFLTVTIDLSITLNYLRVGTTNPSVCYFWMYMDYVLYANGILLLTWASIERHILVFAAHWFRLSRRQFYGHYIPIFFCLIYPIIFYIYTIFFYSCENIFDYQQYLCGSPCFKANSFLLNGYDQLIHTLIPYVIIVLFSLALLNRVIRQKRRVQGQLFSWRKQKRIVSQLLSIVCLYTIIITPSFVIFTIRASISKTFAKTEYTLYISYLFYFLTLFLPFVCLGSVGELRKKIKSLLQTGRQFCLVRSTRVDVIRGQGNRTTAVMPIVAIR